MNKLSKLVFAIILANVLVGCSYVNGKLAQNQQTQRQLQCSNLKNQLTISQGVSGMDGQTSFNNQTKNPTLDANNMRLYNRYRCSEFETSSSNK